MRVSVITVCFNSAGTIERAIRSVLEQTYQDIEFVIVDGCSTDGTVDLVNKFGKDIDIFISEPDRGIYNAMNKGLIRSTGDIVCFLNSDDFYVSSTVISDVVSSILEGAYDIVLGDVKFVSASKRMKTTRKYPARRFSVGKLRFGWMPPHPGFFARRNVYETVGVFDENFKIAGDFDFILRAFTTKSWSYKYLDKTVVAMTEGGVSNSSFKNTLRLNSEVLRSCKKNKTYSNYLMILSKYPLKIYDKIFNV